MLCQKTCLHFFSVQSPQYLGENTGSLLPTLPGCGCALGFVSGGREHVPLEMEFVLVSLLVLLVGFCQQEAPFGLTTEVQEVFGNGEKCLLVTDGGCSV